MDPDACLKRFVDAEHEYVLAGVDSELAESYHEEMVAAHKDLCSWIENGGFEPNWSAYGFTCYSFMNYFKRLEV